MERIQVNGVWYVREFQEEIDIKNNVTNYIGMSYDYDGYIWEATRLIKDDGETFFDDFYIDFTDSKLHTKENWDNMIWLKGILEYNSESINELKKTIDEEGIKHFIAFLKYIEEKGWFKMS